MMGYVPNGYKIWDVKTSVFVTARDSIVDGKDYLITRPVMIAQ